MDSSLIHPDREEIDEEARLFTEFSYSGARWRIVLISALLKLADATGLARAHGELLRPITPWMAGPMKVSDVAFAWRRP